jgi:hypothetical protein
MKMRSIKFKSTSLVVLFFSSFIILNAQESKEDKYDALKNIVEAKQYVFIAETAQPVSGRNRQLSPGYKLELRTDTLISDLPYFGRAYTAPIDPAEGGIQFTSTDFEYQVNPGKKGSWDISIKPKNGKDANRFSLYISKSGKASLQVVSNNRQAISFNGYITGIKRG